VAKRLLEAHDLPSGYCEGLSEVKQGRKGLSCSRR